MIDFIGTRELGSVEWWGPKATKKRKARVV